MSISVYFVSADGVFPVSILKDKIPSFFRSDIVYKFQSGCWNAIYYGKTKRHFNVRVCEDLGICGLTGKGVKGDDDSDIKEHLLIFYCTIRQNILFRI